MLKIFLLLIILLFTPSIFATDLASTPQSNEQLLECDDNCASLTNDLKKFAKKGSPKAQLLLGLAYKTGEILGEIDHNKAWKWMKKSYRQDYPPAYYYLSEWYRTGYNTEIDIVLADEYLKFAAEKGYHPALISLSMLNYKKKDNETGYKLLKQAAEKGNIKARKILTSHKAKTATDEEQSAQNIKNGKSVNNNVSDDNVITIVGNNLSPVESLELILRNIKDQKIYNRIGTTGSRLNGGYKCGHKHSRCRVMKPSSIMIGDDLATSKFGN